MTGTSDILWLREAQCVDIAEHEPHIHVCDAHHYDNAHAHVQCKHAEIYSLQQFKHLSLYTGLKNLVISPVRKELSSSNISPLKKRTSLFNSILICQP
jgi:hypothetical protein